MSAEDQDISWVRRRGFPAPHRTSFARAIVRVHEGVSRLRESSAGWFHVNAERLSLDHSLAAVTEAHGCG